MIDFVSPLSSGLSGLVFNFVYGVGIPLSQSSAITTSVRQVATEWSIYLKDNISLNLQLEFVDLPDPIIGGSRPAMVKVNYKDYVAALFDDKTSQQDWTVLNNLQLDAEDRDMLFQYASGSREASEIKFDTRNFSLYLDSRFNQSNSGQGSSFLDADGDDNNKKIWLTRANAKALNLLRSNDARLDAVIQMSRSVRWDFNPADGISPGTYDFNSVLKHEIGHALGFVSGVDAFEFLTLTQSRIVNDKDLTYVSPIDLFRYSPESAQQGVIDLRIGGGIRKYFSIDRGRTVLADFSTGGTNVGGDGYQASHWKASAQPLGIMQPSLQSGQSLNVSGLDLRLLDAIGWDLESPISAKAAAIGLNWRQLSQQLSERQQTVINTLATSWASKNPGYSIQPDLGYETYRLNFKLNRDIEAEIDALTRKLAPIRDVNRRSQEIQATVTRIWDLQRKQAEELTDFATDREKLDDRVRKWFDLDSDKLAEQMETAVGVEFVKLADLVRTSSPIQRVTWEIKLFAAFLYLTDNPGKAVEELLRTTGPGNGLGWSRWRYWTWFQTGEDASLNLLFRASSLTSSTVDPLTGLPLP